MKFGLHTLIIENHMKRWNLSFSVRFAMAIDYGWGLGYVLLPPHHPLFGKNYDDIGMDVHGGLTFGQIFDSDRFLEWTLDREVFGDITKTNFEKFDGYWIIGFDTNHAGDDMNSCSKDYVVEQTESLLEQCLDDSIEGMKKYKYKYLRKDKLKMINISPLIG